MRRLKQRRPHDPAELFGRPGWRGVIRRIVGEVGLAGAVGHHHVYLIVAGALRAERDLFAVGRPSWQ